MRISDWSSDVCSSDLLHRLASFTALGVVGQGAIDLAVFGADDYPLRTVHAGGTDSGGGQTRMDQDFCLVGETIAGVKTVLAMGQLDPLAHAFGMVRVGVTGIEARHVQRTVIQQVAVDRKSVV